ncbi:MAG: DUF945 family protein [Guyparkeria sp.]
MKRILAIALPVVVVAGAASPLATGKLVESSFGGSDATVEKALAEAGLGDMAVHRVISYESGYLVSTARSELTLTLPDEPPLVFTLDHRIDQVPGLDGRYATVRTDWAPKDPDLRAEVERVLGGEPLLHTDTAMFVSGGTRIDGAVPAIRAEGVDFSGLSMFVDVGGGGGFTYGAESDHLQAEEQGGEARFAGLRLQGSGQVAGDGHVWDGEGRLEVDEVSNPDPRVGGVVRDLAFDYRSARDGELYGLSMGYEVGLAEMADERIEDARARLAIDGLDATAVARLMDRLETLRDRAGGDVEAIDMQAMQDALLKDGLAALDRGVSVTLDPLTAVTPEGRTEARLVAKLPPDVFGAEPNAMMFMALLGQVSVDGTLRVPMALIEKQAGASARQELEPLLTEGWTEIDGDYVQTTLNFERGQLRLNGKSADRLLGGLM